MHVLLLDKYTRCALSSLLRQVSANLYVTMLVDILHPKGCLELWMMVNFERQANITAQWIKMVNFLDIATFTSIISCACVLQSVTLFTLNRLLFLLVVPPVPEPWIPLLHIVFPCLLGHFACPVGPCQSLLVWITGSVQFSA